MLLPRDILSGTYTKPRLFLCETNKDKICQLNTTDTKATLKFNAYSELSFEVARIYNEYVMGETKVNPYYDKIEALRLILVEGFGYFELQGPELISDGIKESKSCKAYSLEYTLAQKYLENFRVNQGTVDSLEVLNAEDKDKIVPITLCNKQRPELSLLHLVLEKCYGWTIGHVDPQLQTMSRQFDIDRESVYDFLMNEVCEKFNCYIVFDTINNTINVYAESPTEPLKGDGSTTTFELDNTFGSVETVSIDGYKTTQWSYGVIDGVGVLVFEEAPKDGAKIEVVGVDSTWETDVFVSFDNLVQEVNVNYDADSIKTVLTVTYGDDHDIREVNLGIPYLTDISYYHTVDWMGQELYDAYNAYLEKANNSQTSYSNNSKEILKINDQISYEENRLSLEYSLASVDASTVGTYYVQQTKADGSFYYSEVSLPADYKVDTKYYSNLTTNVNEDKVSGLHSELKEYACGYFRKDTTRKDEALDEISKLEGFDFLTDYTLAAFVADLRIASSEDVIESAVNKFLAQLWAELGKTPLQKMYLAPYQTRRDTALEAGWSVKSDNNYGSYYMIVLFIDSISAAIAERDKVISAHKEEQSVYQKANAEISNQLLMTNNFTEAQLIRLNAFLREDELHLEDFVETSLDDISSSFTLKKDAMESGRIELKKLCQPQLQFSMTMANIYALPEFAPIVDQFQLGNIIRVSLRKDYVKQSRLLQVDINFDDFSDFSCEFGELTSLRTQSDIHADLLSNAISAGKSVATYSSYWSRGSDTASELEKLIQQGLLDATTAIKATDANQGVVIDKYGIHLTKVDQTTGEVDPKQGWIVNNKFLYSDDGFKSSKSVFGEYTFDGEIYYGILAEALVGELIIGSDLKIGNNSGNLTFDDNGFNITNNINSFVVNPNLDRLLVISNETEDVLYVDSNGNLTLSGTVYATAGEIGGCSIANGLLQIKNANITELLTADKIDATNLKVDAANITGKLVVGQLPSDIATTDDIPANLSELHNDMDYVDADGVTTITEDWILTTDVYAENLVVNAAKINGKLTADQIEVSDIITVGDIATTDQVPTSIGDLDNVEDDVTAITSDWIKTTSVYAENLQVQNVLVEDEDGNTLLDVSDSSVQIASFTVNNYSLYSGTKGNANYIGLFGAHPNEDFTIGDVTSQDWRIIAGQNFGVTSDGTLSATNAYITGTISANDGDIGGWNIAANGLWKSDSDGQIRLIPAGDLSTNYTVNGNTTTEWVMLCGGDNSKTCNFGVTKSGALYASDAYISGEVYADAGEFNGDVYASGGQIGGWDISDNGISSTYSFPNSGGTYLRCGLNKVTPEDLEKVFYIEVYDTSMDAPAYPCYIDSAGRFYSGQVKNEDVNELYIESGYIKTLYNGQTTVYLNNEYGASPILYITEYEDAEAIAQCELSASHFKLGGTSTEPVFYISTSENGDIRLWLNDSGNGKYLSWKEITIGDETFNVLVGTDA